MVHWSDDGAPSHVSGEMQLDVSSGRRRLTNAAIEPAMVGSAQPRTHYDLEESSC